MAAETRNPALKLLAPIAGWMSAVGLHFLHNFLVTFLYEDGVGLVRTFNLEGPPGSSELTDGP